MFWGELRIFMTGVFRQFFLDPWAIDQIVYKFINKNDIRGISRTNKPR